MPCLVHYIVYHIYIYINIAYIVQIVPTLKPQRLDSSCVIRLENFNNPLSKLPLPVECVCRVRVCLCVCVQHIIAVSEYLL